MGMKMTVVSLSSSFLLMLLFTLAAAAAKKYNNSTEKLEKRMKCSISYVNLGRR
jgi:hypothetical protein